MNAKDKIDLLKAEYFKIQDYYESFDSKVQTIKGWSATVSLAAISLGFVNKNGFIWLFSGLTAIVFWFLESKWKYFQYCYAQRIQEIEEAFETENFDDIVPLQIYSSWFTAWDSGEIKLRQIFFMAIVIMPHAYALFISVGLFIAQRIWPSLFW